MLLSIDAFVEKNNQGLEAKTHTVGTWRHRIFKANEIGLAPAIVRRGSGRNCRVFIDEEKALEWLATGEVSTDETA